MLKIIFGVFSITFLVYLILPGPGKITDFPALPNSAKSQLSGDTWQVPNVAAYFSNSYRASATLFYREAYRKLTPLPLLPIRLNHPPEFAYTAIKDQTQSTYLEEYVYPLKGSLFVNGLEPYDQNGKPRYPGADMFTPGDGKAYFTKVTIRYYPSSIIYRVFVWFGINVAILLLYRLGKEAIYGKK